MLAMVSFVICSLFGQVFVLWWARRRGSLFVRRYAWASLALEGIILAMMVPFWLLFGLMIWEPSFELLFVAFLVAASVIQGGMVVLSLVLAVRGWRGRDVADGRGMDWVAHWLPAAELPPVERPTVLGA